MRILKLIFAICVSVLAVLASAAGQQLTITSDHYTTWAIGQWGAAVVNDPTQEATVWGQSADPDGDGLTNLQEYAFGTDPKQPNAYPVSLDYGKATPGYLTINYTQRADDAALVVFPQYSSDLQNWWPSPPGDAFSWSGDSFYYWDTMTGPVVSGMQSVSRVCTQPLADSPATFSRVLVMRSGTTAIGSPLDAINFFDGISGLGGGSVDSNSVVLTGFAGTVNLTVSGGAHLIVNGVDMGTSATVAAGSTIRIRATSPAGASTASYSLSIGGSVTKTWNVTTRPAQALSGVSGAASGYTAVSATVGENGAASISIPITVSPGTAGMEPKLAITYSSQGGNGLLGVGFGISGLSAVTRTGPSLYLDGIKGGVSFGASDRFTVDGQRLVLYSGAWGGDGAVYRTEAENFSNITSTGTTTAGPVSWTVKTKAGLTYDYGTTADSRILANRSTVAGDTAVLTWALARITDNAGNFINFTYATPDGTEGGNPRIASITYTQNVAGGLSPAEQVIFTYAARPDVRTSYVGGAKVVMSKRLTAIDSEQNGNVARHYDFAYQQAEISNNSQLISVTEKGEQPTSAGSVQQAFPPTTFAWDQKPAPTMSLLTATQDPSLANLTFSRSPEALMVQGDFNGDGRTDIMMFDDHLADYYVAFGQSDGSFVRDYVSSSFIASDVIDPTTARIQTGDFNGDGKTDVLHISKSGTNNWLALSNGDGTFRVLRGSQLGALNGLTQTGDYTSEILAMDVTGDGRTDVVALYSTSNSRVFISNGDGSFKEVNPGAAFQAFRISDGRPTYDWILPGDYNGDGLGDILYLYYTGSHSLALSNGDGTFTVRSGSQLGGIAGRSFDLSYGYMVNGDYNGDGLGDIAFFNDHGLAWEALCKGDGSFDTIVNPPSLQNLPTSNSGPTYGHYQTGDLNGDGFSDFFFVDFPSSFQVATGAWLGFSEGDTNFSVLLNGHMGALDNQSYDSTEEQSRIFIGDFDGDGTEDVLHVHYGGGSYLARSNGFNADRVVQVTNGHGGYTKFNYKPLTDPTVYTKGTAAVYPDYDVIGAMYVVSYVVTRNGMDGDAFTVQANPAPGESTTTYTYERAWSVLDGHGYQGFAAVQSVDQDTGITSRTEYVTTDPNLSGHPAHQIQTLSNGTAISETINSWVSSPTTLPSGMINYFPYTTQSVTKDYEINNGPGAAPIKTTTVSATTYDAYGNLTHSFTDYGRGFTEETTSSYYPADTVHWWLGRLSSTVVTQTSPGPVTATRQSTFQYSPTNGQLTRESIVTPESNLQLQKDYVQDAFGNILQSTFTDLNTKATRTTVTAYTPDGRFINQTTNALGQVETKICDPLNGTVLSQTGPNGLTTTWSYDGFGRPITENRPDGTMTYTQYLLCGPGSGVPPRAVHCVRTQSSGSGPSTVYFDILDRQIRQDATGFDGSTISMHRVFDAKGEIVATSLPFFSSSIVPTAPLAQYTTYIFDAISRVIEQDVPGAQDETTPRVTTTGYAGLTATVTNPKKETFQTVVDVRGRTASSTSFGTDTVSNTHDPYGNLIQVDDGHGHLTTMQYDGRGNKISMTEPNSGTTTYGYNAFGELISQTDALRRATTLAYDSLGRMTSRVEPDAAGIYNGVQAAGIQVETDWVYETGLNGQPNPNGVGKLAYVFRHSDGYVESYRYDTLGRLTETLTQTGALQFVSSTTFDEYSRPDTLSYPTGFAVRNAYNQYGHLASVYDAANPTLVYWNATSVNARGQVLQEQLGNGLNTIRGYDPNTGLLLSIQTGSGGGGTSVQNLAYTFDNLNNLTERQDLNRGITENFGYDTTNQLSGVTCSAADSVTISCDPLGNITSRSDVGTYNYGENGAGPHAVTSITGINGQPSRTLTYNAVGDCVQDGTTTLVYNAANQPSSIFASTGSILFSYTPSRARLKRTELINGALTSRVYVGSLYERDDGPAGIVHTCFIPAGGGVVAIHTQTQTVAGTTSQTRYVHKDHLGSVQSLTDENGLWVETDDYDTWGRRRTFNSTTGRFTYTGATSQTDRGFTGHEMLDAVGLIHMNGRIYDPTIGRFLSVDPVVQEAGNLQNLNRYAYVLNNPLSLTDPSGFSFFGSVGKWFAKHWQTVVQVAATALYFIPGAQGIALAVNIAVAFGTSFTGTLLAGGSVGDAFRAGVTSAGVAYASAEALNGASDRWGWSGEEFEKYSSGQFVEKLAEKTAFHGVVGGVGSEIMGGKFVHGFFASAVSAAASPTIYAGTHDLPYGDALGTTAAATVGGTVSALGGGKFANGAITSSMAYIQNTLQGDPQHDREQEKNALELIGLGSDETSALFDVGQAVVEDPLWKDALDVLGSKPFGFIGAGLSVGVTGMDIEDAWEDPSVYKVTNAGVSFTTTGLGLWGLANPWSAAASASLEAGYVVSTRTGLIIRPMAWGFHTFVDSSVSSDDYANGAYRDLR